MIRYVFGTCGNSKDSDWPGKSDQSFCHHLYILARDSVSGQWRP